MPNPVIYAEETLGVHKIYEDSIALHKEYDTLLTDLDTCKDKKRNLESVIWDREIQVFVETKSTHADKSATALEPLIKTAKNQDSELRQLRADLDGIAGEVSGLELDIESRKSMLRIMCARMEELGGYFNYLASAKNAQTLLNNAQNANTAIQR